MSKTNQSMAEGAYTAFEGQKRIAAGDLKLVVRAAKSALAKNGPLPVLIFDDATGGVVDLPVRTDAGESAASTHVAQTATKRSAGRPKLGVLAREVTLLPAQWDWLDAQVGGASSTLRRLVHDAKKRSAPSNSARLSQEAVYKFMTAMAGDLPGFEEALRAFYRKEEARFNSLIQRWPKDISKHIKKLVALAGDYPVH